MNSDGRHPPRQMTAFDPGCVKTHTLKECGKYNQREIKRGTRIILTLMMRNFFETFYARRRRWSFHTAKTHSGLVALDEWSGESYSVRNCISRFDSRVTSMIDDDCTSPACLTGGGEMGARMRAKDWCASPLGHPERW